MNWNTKNFISFLSLALSTAPWLSAAAAVELEDLAGTWSLNTLDTPARIRETFYNVETGQTRIGDTLGDVSLANEIVVDLFLPDPFEVSSQLFQFTASGSLSGAENGTVTQMSGGRLAYASGGESYTIYANPAGDILKQSAADEDRQSLALALKRPLSLAAADLAGEWNVASYTTPDALTVHSLDGRVVDAFFIGEFRSFRGHIAIGAGGAISGDLSGTAAVQGPGSVSVSVGGGPVTFAVNASKNVMIATLAQDDEVEYIVLTKRPETLVTSELAGSWRVTALEVPDEYVESYYNSDTGQARQADLALAAGGGEQWADAYHPALFSFRRFSMEVAASGTFSALGGGSLAADGAGGLIVSVDGETTPLDCNEDKSLLTGIIDDGAGSQVLIIAIRVGAAAATRLDDAVDLKMSQTAPGAPLVLSWNGASDLTLQFLDEAGIWQDAALPDGADSLLVDPTAFGTKGLFRIAQQPPAAE